MRLFLSVFSIRPLLNKVSNERSRFFSAAAVIAHVGPDIQSDGHGITKDGVIPRSTHFYSIKKCGERSPLSGQMGTEVPCGIHADDRRCHGDPQSVHAMARY